MAACGRDEGCFDGGPVGGVLTDAPSPFSFFAAAFGSPAFFGVPTCLLGGSFVVVVADGSDAVCAVRDPGVEMSDVLVKVAGGVAVGVEGIDLVGLRDFAPSVMGGAG